MQHGCTLFSEVWLRNLDHGLSRVATIHEKLQLFILYLSDELQCSTFGEYMVDGRGAFGASYKSNTAGAPIFSWLPCGSKVVVSENSREVSLPVFVSNVTQASTQIQFLQAVLRRGVKSFCAVPLYRGDAVRGWIECHVSRHHLYWNRQLCYRMYLATEVLERQIGSEIQRAKQLSPVSRNSSKELHTILRGERKKRSSAHPYHPVGSQAARRLSLLRSLIRFGPD